jgi:hypothetical protein
MSDASLPAGLVPLPDDLQAEVDAAIQRWTEGDLASARPALEAALTHAAELGSRWGVIQATHFLANLAFNECRDDDSWRLHAEVLAEGEALDFAWAIGTSVGSLAFVDVVRGRFDDAAARFDRGIAAYEAAGRDASATQLRALRERLVVDRVPIGSLIPRRCDES